MNPAPSWLEWFTISIPLCILGNFTIWLWLLWNYKPERQTPQIHTIRPSTDPITFTQIYVILVTLLTIVLWCLAHTYESVFGDMGVIAILPLIAFFGTGLLTKDDFNSFLWNVIVLAMGGIALGKAVESSGLLKTIASQIQTLVAGMSAIQVLFVFSCLVLVIATFISHTVAALIVLPIVAEVGSQLADPQPRMLVMVCAAYIYIYMTLICILTTKLGYCLCLFSSYGIACIRIPQHERDFTRKRAWNALFENQRLFA